MTSRAGANVFKPSSISRAGHAGRSRPTFARTNSNSNSTTASTHSPSHSLEFGKEFVAVVGTGASNSKFGAAAGIGVGEERGVCLPAFADLNLGWSSPGNSPLPSPHKKDLEEAKRIGRSRPIAIELPPRRPSGPVSTPPEPLSARGDLPGGYFPLHEDISRSYKPHPFHPESSSKTASSLQQPQTPKEDPDSEAEQYTPLGHPFPLLLETPPIPTFKLPPTSESLSINRTSSREKINTANLKLNLNLNMNTNTNIPPLALGKYHPSQYKNKSGKAPGLNTTSSNSSNGSLVKSGSRSSNSEEPGGSSLQGHSRNSSDVRRKLQQYQRDMVDQAALAGRIAMERQSPTSPRLEPLGSPGPVTPMVLEESGGYLMAGFAGMRPASGTVMSPLANPGREVRSGDGRVDEQRLYDAGEMVKRMIREEEERDREMTRQRSVGNGEVED